MSCYSFTHVYRGTQFTYLISLEQFVKLSEHLVLIIASLLYFIKQLRSDAFRAWLFQILINLLSKALVNFHWWHFLRDDTSETILRVFNVRSKLHHLGGVVIRMLVEETLPRRAFIRTLRPWIGGTLIRMAVYVRTAVDWTIHLLRVVIVVWGF